MSRVRGLRVVITGASGGIGSAVVAKLESGEAEVRGVDVRAAPGVEVADVTDRVQIEGAVDRAAGELNGIDVLINNAGIGQPQDAGGFPDERARAIMDVNFFGAWNSTAAAMPHLLASRGHVVNVSSGLALVNLPFAAAYSASKRALDAYSEALRLEYEGRLSVTSVHPGYIRTPMHHESTIAGALSKDLRARTHSKTQPRRSCEPSLTNRGRSAPATAPRWRSGRPDASVALPAG